MFPSVKFLEIPKDFFPILSILLCKKEGVFPDKERSVCRGSDWAKPFRESLIGTSSSSFSKESSIPEWYSCDLLTVVWENLC